MCDLSFAERQLLLKKCASSTCADGVERRILRFLDDGDYQVLSCRSLKRRRSEEEHFTEACKYLLLKESEEFQRRKRIRKDDEVDLLAELHISKRKTVKFHESVLVIPDITKVGFLSRSYSCKDAKIHVHFNRIPQMKRSCSA